MTAATLQNRNGVDLTRLNDTVAAIRQTPELAAFQFRTSNRWIDGGHNTSEINDYFGAKQEHTRDMPFVLDADEPPVLLGNDMGANPVEFVLHALAACLTTSTVYHAAARGINIASMKSRLEGDIDLRGFLGLDPSIRKGYSGIRVTFEVATDGELEQLQELSRSSPVFDIISNPVPVTVEFRKAVSK